MSLRVSLDVAPDWWETLYLVQRLALDPSSHVAASLAGWSRPWSAETWVLADLVDAFIRANTTEGRAMPYPRPNDQPPARSGDSSARPQAEIVAALRARGHDV